jgi:hypothetical protein
MKVSKDKFDGKSEKKKFQGHGSYELLSLAVLCLPRYPRLSGWREEQTPCILADPDDQIPRLE